MSKFTLELSAPEHVVTMWFWVPVIILLIHTVRQIFLLDVISLNGQSLSGWPHKVPIAWADMEINTPHRKRFALAVHITFLAVALLVGSYILKTDLAVWGILATSAPAGALNRFNLEHWIIYDYFYCCCWAWTWLTLAAGACILWIQICSVRKLMGVL